MGVQFIVERWPSEQVEQTLNKTHMLARVARFAMSARRFRFRERDEGEPRSDWTDWMGRIKALAYVERKMSRNPVGFRLFIQRGSDDAQLRIWKIRAASTPDTPDWLPADLPPDLAAIYQALFTKFQGQIRDGGTWFCRFVLNTSTVSKHGYQTSKYKGYALDWFVTNPNTMAFLEETGNWLVQQTLMGKLNATKIIVNDWQWTPERGKQPYGGAKHYHGHVEVVGGNPCTP